MPDLGEEILVNELIHAGQENAEAGVRMIPADHNGRFIRIPLHQLIIHVPPAFRRVGHTCPLHHRIFGDNRINHMDNIATIWLFLGAWPNHHPRDFTV